MKKSPYKAYKGDRMPSALPQKSKSGKIDEDKALTLSDISKGRDAELNKKIKLMDPFTAEAFDFQAAHRKMMKESVDSMNRETTKKFDENMAAVKAKKMDPKEAAKWDRSEFTWGKKSE